MWWLIWLNIGYTGGVSMVVTVDGVVVVGVVDELVDEVIVEVGVVVVVVGVDQFIRMLFDWRGEVGSLIKALVCALLSVGSRRFHFFLSRAMVQTDSKDRWEGISWKMLPFAS